MVLEILKPTDLLSLIFSNMIQGINIVLKGIVKNPLLCVLYLNQTKTVTPPQSVLSVVW